MDGYQVRFDRALRNRIEAIIIDRCTVLSSSPASDYPSYMERVGFIKGLRHSLQEMNEVQSDLSNPEKPVSSKGFLKGYET